jgi:hypothetical protein
MIWKHISRIFIGERFEWNVSLKPEQVLSDLRGKNQGSFIERMFSPGVSARASGNKFSFSKMSIGNIPMSGNAFTHVLVGKVEEAPYGSKVTAHFRLPIHVFVFATFWLGLAYAVGFVGGIGSAIETINKGNYSGLGNSAFMTIFPIFGTLFLHVFRKMAARNENEIITMVSEYMESHKVGNQTG